MLAPTIPKLLPVNRIARKCTTLFDHNQLCVDDSSTVSRPPAAARKEWGLLSLLLSYFFLKGAFASGVVPALEVWQPGSAAGAFFLYFCGVIGGQSLVAFVARVSRTPLSNLVAELLFGGSLVLIGLTGPAFPTALTAGRLMEGIGSGMGLPLMFGAAMRLRVFERPERSALALNAVFGAGFLTGPLLSPNALVHLSPTAFIAGAGVVFLCLSSLVFPLLWPVLSRPQAFGNDEAAVSSRTISLEIVVTLATAKAIYGFLMPALGDVIAMKQVDITMTRAFIWLDVTFVCGQVLCGIALSRMNAVTTRRLLSVGLVIALLLFALTHSLLLGVLVALLQSATLGWAAARLTKKPDSVQSFAQHNVMTDPAMALGAGLAHHPWMGLYGLAAISVLPGIWQWGRTRNEES